MYLINIFKMVVLSSLIGSLIVLIILIAKALFKSKLNCFFHYYIWLILLVKLIIPFGPKTPLNISDIHEKLYVKSIINEKMQVNPSAPSQNIDLKNSFQLYTLPTSDKNLINNPMNISLKNKINIEKALCFLWILVIVLLTGMLVEGHKRLRKILRISIKDVKSTHKKVLHNCMNAMDIKTELEILYSPKISSPSLCGFIKPKILIPVKVAVSVCDEEFKYIIMHELCHFKNKDILINCIISLLSVVYWFNPILLYGFRKMRQDCEFFCDSEVLSYLEDHENIQYGNSIIRVLELVGSTKRLTGTTSMVMNSQEIKRRIIMISNYKKINIKGILLGVILMVTLGSVGIVVNASNISQNKDISKAKTLQETQSAVLLSPNIVIYNSHPDEAYPSGMTVTDVAVSINDKLIKEGLNSSFIKSTAPTEYRKSYENSRNLIIKNVKNYPNTILLDIHRDVTDNSKSDTKKILFILAKNNPHYEWNKKFVDSLLENIKNSSGVKPEIFFFETGTSYFNQDLSKNSVIIEVGNNNSSNSDIEECVNAIVSALKNIQNTTSN